MAIPPTAVKFANTLDPHENLDWVAQCATILELGEQIDTFSLVLLPEAVALGLTILATVDGFANPAKVENDQSVKLWLTIDDAFEDDAAFEGAGTALGMELTIVTNSTPPRTRQRTFLVQVAQQ